MSSGFVVSQFLRVSAVEFILFASSVFLILFSVNDDFAYGLAKVLETAKIISIIKV